MSNPGARVWSRHVRPDSWRWMRPALGCACGRPKTVRATPHGWPSSTASATPGADLQQRLDRHPVSRRHVRAALASDLGDTAQVGLCGAGDLRLSCSPSDFKLARFSHGWRNVRKCQHLVDRSALAFSLLQIQSSAALPSLRLGWLQGAKTRRLGAADQWGLDI